MGQIIRDNRRRGKGTNDYTEGYGKDRCIGYGDLERGCTLEGTAEKRVGWKLGRIFKQILAQKSTAGFY